MEQKYFRPIEFAEFGVLKTDFYKEVDTEILSMDLKFNPKYCTKLKAEKEKKNNKNKGQMQYYYADFEADTTTEIHKAYYVNVQSIDGNICKSFKGEDCGKKLLEYLPNNSTVIFHNLAYDIRMLAKYGIEKAIMRGKICMNATIRNDNK